MHGPDGTDGFAGFVGGVWKSDLCGTVSGVGKKEAVKYHSLGRVKAYIAAS